MRSVLQSLGLFMMPDSSGRIDVCVPLPVQGAAEVGVAVDPEGRFLELSAAAPWRQALLKKLALSNDKKSNLQVIRGCMPPHHKHGVC